MFDVPLNRKDISYEAIGALPAPLRGDVEQASKVQSPLQSANYSVVAETVFRGRMVCVGDAGGCCHPLTATGLSACARDAILLRQALRETAADIPVALRRYAGLRESPQRTRSVGAELLYRVFSSETPDMRLMRTALFRYWQGNPRGRSATMALLSTREDSFSVMLREYLNVCRNALPDLVRWRGMEGVHPSYTRGHAVIGLSRELIKLVGSR
jgi:2-polyprenyl-6-methoxyphenol hydroxylase-like FAD-dependent oxidoreductase